MVMPSLWQIQAIGGCKPCVAHLQLSFGVQRVTEHLKMSEHTKSIEELSCVRHLIVAVPQPK